MVGVPGVKKITLTVGDKIGKTMLRAVYARSWEFKGFNEEYDEAKIQEHNLVTFQINVVDPTGIIDL